MAEHPRQILVIRHGEKPGSDVAGGPAAVGLHEDGSTDPHSLTVRGWQRAGALTALLAADLVSGRPPILRPTVLLAPGYGAHDTSHRPVQTLQPISARLGVTVNGPCPREDTNSLVVDHVLPASDEVVLVCWDHEHIPAIVDQLSTSLGLDGPAFVGGRWPDERYDVVLAFTRQDVAASGSSRFQFAEVPQLLLGGDSPQRITSS